MTDKRIATVTPLTDMRLLVTFQNGAVKLFDVRPIIRDYPEYATLENPDIFALVAVEPGGYGVSWTPELDASEGELWDNGISLPLSCDDLASFVGHNVINTAEACELLACTRQNIDDLVRRGQLRPLRSFQRGKLFLRGDVAGRKPTQPQA